MVSTTRVRLLVALALACGPICSTAASAAEPSQQLTGVARVVDGDTIVVGDTRVRLEGIDAPETGQTCERKRVGTWACGSAATLALIALVEGRNVACERSGVDKYARVLGRCVAEGRDVNAAMVRQGHAWAFVKYSTTYVAEEAAARAEGLGIWQGNAMPAWDYRAQRWAAVEQAAPENCPIKGNVTKHGRIYHMPWSPWYAQIRIEPDKGKRWFCTEAEALAAGWRPVHTH
jgi:endonuclease YncB( thermonuclease family)